MNDGSSEGMTPVTVPAGRVAAVQWLLAAPRLVQDAFVAPLLAWEAAWNDPETAAWLRDHGREWLASCPDRERP